MGRWRPPPERSSPYITAEGHARLEQELDDLWKQRREVVAALSAAAAEGDRSENAEYIYRKKQLREMDRRIRYLQKRLPSLKVVARHPFGSEQIFFGAWVTLEDENGKQNTWRIVGPDEIDTARGWISMDSPMAKALMRKSVDDDVLVDTPDGRREFVIVALRYVE